MSELFNLKTIDDAIKTFIEALEFSLLTEHVSLKEANNRILAQRIISTEDVPQFNRSTMDGYAVKSEDTFGASEDLPAFLTLTGEITMGQKAMLEVNAQEAVKVATGAMIPKGADAVVMVEDTERTNETIEVNAAVSPGQHIVLKGDDLKQGKVILEKGHKIRPQDIGALAALGVTTVEVNKKINITVFSTGDELIEPQEKLSMGKIRDINSYTVGALGKIIDANVIYGGIVPDQHQALTTKIKEHLNQSDLILLSGGSSVGTKDITLDVINGLGKPGVLVHGIAIKPGKPTILSVVNNKGIIGLPGHPVSAMMVFKKVVEPIIHKLMHDPSDEFRTNTTIKAKLTKNVASTRGREEYLRVKLFKTDNQLLAEPILGSSSLISTLVRADGLIKVPLGTEGIAKDTLVAVELFE